ncbi:RNA polymerase sigma factor [Rhodopirellula bahusiensis]|uniref:RNA polymerase sigma factor n=2 Tax=Rhodopirellula bahusiensis TaxID=2014065 RepID=UPI00326521DB
MTNSTSESVADTQLELAFRLMEDDTSALAEIVELYGSAIIRMILATYKTFNAEDAEDVLSIAIAKLWDRRQQYDEGDGPLRAYLYKIADNTAKDIFKCGWDKARRLPVDFGLENAIELIPEDKPDENESKRKRKDWEKRRHKEISDLMAVLDGLPEKERAVVISDAYARDRVTDATTLSDELGIAVGSVRGYRSRAWKTIRAKMTELGHKLPAAGEPDGKR